jgi:hypothetical protein
MPLLLVLSSVGELARLLTFPPQELDNVIAKKIR